MAEKKGKKKKKNKTPSKRWEYYGEKNKARFCPRCGPGIFLAKHKDRLYCGKCHYTEFIK
ncbi:MAG: 30S ribosomal protein S27ae [Candidatus Pacearchaeota archaeon]